MAKVPHGVEILPKISIVWVGRTNVTDRRQTTDNVDDSEHELEFTFAKKQTNNEVSFVEFIFLLPIQNRLHSFYGRT